MKIKIYAIGHLKEPYLKQGIHEYLERLKPYTQIEIIEVNDESIIDNPSPNDIGKGFPTFPAHLRMRPVSRGNSRRSLVGGTTC